MRNNIHSSLLTLAFFILSVSVFSKEKGSFKNELSKIDSIYLDSITSTLKGIEFYAGKENYFFLPALFQAKGQTKLAKKINSILDPSGDKAYNAISIEKLDKKGGYISYLAFLGDTHGSLTYWNLSDGSKLIGKVESIGQTISESVITFKKHSNNEIVTLKNTEVIPAYNKLESNLSLKCKSLNVPFDEDIPEFEFYLPQKGKDITYCDYNKRACLTLEFSDGKFLTIE